MSTNPMLKEVPLTAIKMVNETTKLIGLPKLNAQIVITLPDINEFNEELKESMDFSQGEVECFIITKSTPSQIQSHFKKFGLSESVVSNDFKKYASIFDLKDEKNDLIKSLIMINKDCKIMHKEIM